MHSTALRLLAGASILWACSAQAMEPVRFAFGTTPAPAGFTRVAPDTGYTIARGYGFEPGAAQSYFSVDLPEGNYRVTVTLGDDQPATTTIKAELRRLMLENVATGAGETTTRSFIVNLRTPVIAPRSGVAAAVRPEY